MNFFEKIVYVFSAEMTPPTMYGWFHILFLLLMIGLTIFLCWKCRDCSNKVFKWIIASAWIVMVLFEIYKQLVFSFNYNNGSPYWDFEWYAFPFQLCSTPIYVLPFIAFCKAGKFRDSCMAYVSTFAFFGGLATMIFPSMVFTEYIGINIQSLVHHGLQVVLGIFIMVHERKRLDIKFFLKGIFVFAVAISLAFIMNIIAHFCTTEKFNMFYIGPYLPSTLPLLDIIYANTPYPVFLLIYVVGIIIAALVVYYAQYGFIKLGMRSKKSANKERQI